MSERFRVGLIGHGIGPSLTPAMHMREAVHLGLDYTYEVIDLAGRPDADLAAVLDDAERDGFDALNVTHPFKQAALELVELRSTTVDVIGSTNLVLFRPEGRIAHNTDYGGFRSGLEEFLGADSPRDTVLQIGAGGAGLATACALADMDVGTIVVHDRSAAAAHSLIARFDRHSGGRLRSTYGDLDSWLGTCDGVVHVTPTGMREHPGVALDIDRLGPRAWVSEVVYRPLETELVRRARARGLRVLDGGAMAVGQAVESLRLITGLEPDPARMRRHFAEIVAAPEPTGGE